MKEVVGQFKTGVKFEAGGELTPALAAQMVLEIPVMSSPLLRAMDTGAIGVLLLRFLLTGAAAGAGFVWSLQESDPNADCFAIAPFQHQGFASPRYLPKPGFVTTVLHERTRLYGEENVQMLAFANIARTQLLRQASPDGLEEPVIVSGEPRRDGQPEEKTCATFSGVPIPEAPRTGLKGAPVSYTRSPRNTRYVDVGLGIRTVFAVAEASKSKRVVVAAHSRIVRDWFKTGLVTDGPMHALLLGTLYDGAAEKLDTQRFINSKMPNGAILAFDVVKIPSGESGTGRDEYVLANAEYLFDGAAARKTAVPAARTAVHREVPTDANRGDRGGDEWFQEHVNEDWFAAPTSSVPKPRPFDDWVIVGHGANEFA